MTDEITCPRCGCEQPQAAECSRCGILFAKIRSEGPRPAAPPDAAPDTAPADRGRSSFASRFVLLCLGATVAAYLYARNQAPPPVPDWHGPASAPQASQGASREVRPVRMPYEWYEGASGYAEAMEEARQGHRVVAVYFYTDWCHYCRQLESELLHTREVEGHLATVVKVKINPESGVEEGEIARRYGIEGYPSFFIEAPHLGRRQMIERTTGDRLKTPDEFVATCRQAAAG